MKPTLYLECASGISGDMTVAALLDLGADRGALDRALASLPVDGFEVHVGRVAKSGLDACDFDVRLDEAHENHDHDMAYLFGHEHGGAEAHGEELHHAHAHAHDGHGHAHEHGHARGHGHDGHHHDHGHDGHHHEHEHGRAHHHEHRTLADVVAVIDAAELTPGARDLAKRVFSILAAAEAQAHGTTPDQVHFHEVGAVDSIVDIVAAAVCLDSLDVEGVVVGDLAEGTGTVRCAHGVIPVPVPAVCAIAAAHRLPLRTTSVRGELVTPTGAAIAAAVRTSDRLPERYLVKKVGLGAGKRSYEGCSGVLRAMLVEPLGTEGGSGATTDSVVKLECDVDDCTGEALGRVLDELMAAGAREAHFLPVFTKKSRPAYQLQVVCDEAVRPALERLIFEETTTIGIRRCTMERTVLPRRACTVETPLGPMPAKEVALPSGRRRVYPEHDGVVAAAERAGVPYQEAYRACLAACNRAAGCVADGCDGRAGGQVGPHGAC